jgi:signal transduction histidine kinase
VTTTTHGHRAADRYGFRTVAAVTAEATALRRLERDIHDGPQQRLVRLAMELGRAQHHLDSRPEAVRAALADAIVQTEEALDELRALSRGIAPPILVDRGLRAALTALAARSTIPVELDADHLDRWLNAAVETAAYFVIAEALALMAEGHSNAAIAQRMVVSASTVENTSATSSPSSACRPTRLSTAGCSPSSPTSGPDGDPSAPASGGACPTPNCPAHSGDRATPPAERWSV